jgi:predicted esterase YcpF (UPF0227 family)
MLSCGTPEISMLIYLHGLNSSGQSYKGGVLRERLAPTAVLSPSYPAHRPDTAVAVLTGVFRELVGKRPPLVVGSSMGGFYGQYLARQFAFAHLFLINPALTPWDLLREYEGMTQTTACGKTYRIDRAMIESTRKYEVADPCEGVPTTLFMDRADEVIDYRIAESLYRRCGRLLIFDGGDHSFQHLETAIAVIQEEIARCEHGCLNRRDHRASRGRDRASEQR